MSSSAVRSCQGDSGIRGGQAGSCLRSKNDLERAPGYSRARDVNRSETSRRLGKILLIIRRSLQPRHSKTEGRDALAVAIGCNGWRSSSDLPLSRPDRRVVFKRNRRHHDDNGRRRRRPQGHDRPAGSIRTLDSDACSSSERSLGPRRQTRRHRTPRFAVSGTGAVCRVDPGRDHRVDEKSAASLGPERLGRPHRREMGSRYMRVRGLRRQASSRNYNCSNPSRRYRSETTTRDLRSTRRTQPPTIPTPQRAPARWFARPEEPPHSLGLGRRATLGPGRVLLRQVSNPERVLSLVGGERARTGSDRDVGRGGTKTSRGSELDSGSATRTGGCVDDDDPSRSDGS